MRVTSNLQWPETPFARPDRFFGAPERFMVALDVEWTKNYKVKNGSRPFCYSLVLLHWPQDDDDLTSYPATFGFKSVYVTSAEDEPALIASLDSDLQAWLTSDSVLGFQARKGPGGTTIPLRLIRPRWFGDSRRWCTRPPRNIRKFLNTYSVTHAVRMLEDLNHPVGHVGLVGGHPSSLAGDSPRVGSQPRCREGIVYPLWAKGMLPTRAPRTRDQPDLGKFVQFRSAGPHSARLIRLCCGREDPRAT